MPNRVKVCHVAEATAGGVRTHLLDLASNLSNYEQVFMVSCVRNPNILRELSTAGVTAIRLDMVRNISPLKDLISFVQLYRMIRRAKVDIVHCHSSKAGFLGRFAAKLAGVGIVMYTPHAFPFNVGQGKLKNRVYSILERLAGRITTRLICVADSERNEAIRRRIIDGQRAVVIHNGIRPTVGLRPREMDSKKRLVVGFVGRLTFQKNPLELIRAFRYLREQNIELRIVGDGELRDDCERTVTQLEIEDQVTLLGHLSDPQKEMETFDLLVMPSLWEGLPYVLLEAMSIGVVVVGTNIDGISDVVADGVNGYLYEPGDELQLSNIISFLAGNPSLVYEVGARASNTVNSSYTVDNMIKNLDKVYTAAFDER